jgi:hypothetical protein
VETKRWHESTRVMTPAGCNICVHLLYTSSWNCQKIAAQQPQPGQPIYIDLSISNFLLPPLKLMLVCARPLDISLCGHSPLRSQLIPLGMVNSPLCWLNLGTKTANSIERGISDGYFAGSAPSTNGLATKVIVHCQKGQLGSLYIIVCIYLLLM